MARPSRRRLLKQSLSSRLGRATGEFRLAPDAVRLAHQAPFSCRQTNHSLSDKRTEYLIKGQLSFMRILGQGLADMVPDANTIWTFWEALDYDML